MEEKTIYRKRLENDVFYSFGAPALLFSDYASKTICKQFGITHKELRVLAAARLFMNVRQYARTRHLQKVMKYDKFEISKVLKVMAEKGLLERVQRDVVKRHYNKNIKSYGYYYKIGATGKLVVKAFNKELVVLIRQFDEDRRGQEYKNIKLDDKYKAI